MRVLLKILLFLAGTVLLFLIVAFCWVYFYSRDLPDIKFLAQYAPATVTQVSDPCLGQSVAVPYEAIGASVRNAISSGEAREDDPGVLTTIWKFGELHRRRLSAAISMTMCFAPSTQLRRQIAEIRTAVQLEQRYARRRLFNIYANRVYLGPGLTGVQNGAEFYFRKNSVDLSAGEAALLVGLLRSPTVYSPLKHADRALKRRNQVLDAMAENGSISAADAQAAKVAPLGVVSGSAATIAQ